jgi:hypothetical protein
MSSVGPFAPDAETEESDSVGDHRQAGREGDSWTSSVVRVVACRSLLIAVGLLEERLVRASEVVIEEHTMDPPALG